MHNPDISLTLAEQHIVREKELHSAALHFLVGVQNPATKFVALHAAADRVEFLLTHPRYKRRDSVDLFVEAREYTLGRILVGSREAAIAVLISRDERKAGRFPVMDIPEAAARIPIIMPLSVMAVLA